MLRPFAVIHENPIKPVDPIVRGKTILPTVPIDPNGPVAFRIALSIREQPLNELADSITK